jgi:hypothetical protein
MHHPSIFVRETAIMKRANILIALIVGTALAAFAESSENGDHKVADDHHGESHHHANHVALFMGLTSNLDKEHTDFTLGADYEQRISDKWGAGLIGELVFAEHRENILGVQVFHHIDSFKIFGGPGIALAKIAEHGEDEHAEDDGHGKANAVVEAHAEDAEESWHKEFLFRLGAGYDFHYNKLSITPTVSADYIDRGIAVIYGVGVGFGF